MNNLQPSAERLSVVNNRYLLWLLAALGAIVLSLWQSGLFQKDILNPGGWGQFWRFAAASVHPDLSPDLLQLTLTATLKTLAYAVCGTCLSVLLGLIGGVLGSEVWWLANSRGQRPRLIHNSKSIIQNFPTPHSPFLFVHTILAIPRAIHELIWGLIFVNLFGLDPLVAVLAIALPFGAITAKVFAELLDETPLQPLMVLLNSGVSPFNAFLYGLLPQAFLNLLSYSFYRFECSIRSAAVLGIIGAGGLGYEILLSLQSLRYEQLWTFFYALVVLNGCVDFASAWLRQRLGCSTRLDLNHGKGQKGERGSEARGQGSGLKIQNSKFKIQNSKFIILFPLLLIALSFWYVNADFSKLWSPVTAQRIWSMLSDCIPPDWQVVSQLWTLSGQTVAMSVLAIALAAGVEHFFRFLLPIMSSCLGTAQP